MTKTDCKHSQIAGKEEEYPLLGTNLSCVSVCLISGLGTGGLGSVYLAEECGGRSNTEVAATTTKLFAAKVVDTRKCDATYLLESLRKTHQFHAKVALHPNIIQIYSFHDTPDYIVVFLEYAKDGDVFDLLENHGRAISRDSALLKSIFLQVLDAVVHIHKYCIFHCDIKADNLLLKQEGDMVRVKLSDFGCSTNKQIIYDDYGRYSGTSLYLPPECLPQAMSISIYALPVAIDIWSLGVFLFNLCSGGLMPWDEASVSDGNYRLYLDNPAAFFSAFSMSPATEDILKEFWTIDLWQRDRIGVKKLREKIELIDEFTTYADTFSGLQENHEQPLLSSAAWQRGRYKDVLYCLDSETQKAALDALALLDKLETNAS